MQAQSSARIDWAPTRHWNRVAGLGLHGHDAGGWPTCRPTTRVDKGAIRQKRKVASSLKSSRSRPICGLHSRICLASPVPAMAAGACIGDSEAPIGRRLAGQTERRYGRSSSVVPRWACSRSTGICQWAGASSRPVTRYRGLITCGGSSVWTPCPSGRSPVSSSEGVIAGKGS